MNDSLFYDLSLKHQVWEGQFNSKKYFNELLFMLV